MDPEWLGQFTTIQDSGKGLEKLKLLKNPEVQVKRINGAHLKLYNTKTSPLPTR